MLSVDTLLPIWSTVSQKIICNFIGIHLCKYKKVLVENLYIPLALTLNIIKF